MSPLLRLPISPEKEGRKKGLVILPEIVEEIVESRVNSEENFVIPSIVHSRVPSDFCSLVNGPNRGFVLADRGVQTDIPEPNSKNSAALSLEAMLGEKNDII